MIYQQQNLAKRSSRLLDSWTKSCGSKYVVKFMGNITFKVIV